MKLNNFAKYFLRFTFLQVTITTITIWYFDKFVFLSSDHKFEIYLKIVEDYERFYNFIPLSLITIDSIFFTVIFLFLVLLYTTKFYTYVNELDFSYKNKYLDDYVMLYFMWNSYFFSALFLFRVEGLVRSYLILFTLIVPFLLLLLRNGEIISNILGRSISKENYISFNLEGDSNFKNLRVLAFRNEKLAVKADVENINNIIIEEVNNLNKSVNLNLIVLNINTSKRLPIELEEYLINLNKKVLLLSSNELVFHTNFIYRFTKIDSKYIYYFNNDVQYGSKYILKRILDISISLIVLLFISPILLFIFTYIRFVDGSPSIISQNRVGLHGRKFNMYKFRTMYSNAHSERGRALSGLLENDCDKELVAASRNGLAETLRASGQLVEAGRLLKKNYEEAVEMFGQRHPHTARALNFLAKWEFDDGQHKSALKHLIDALSIQCENLGEFHHNSIAIASNIISISREFPDLQTAESSGIEIRYGAIIDQAIGERAGNPKQAM